VTLKAVVLIEALRPIVPRVHQQRPNARAFRDRGGAFDCILKHGGPEMLALRAAIKASRPGTMTSSMNVSLGTQASIASVEGDLSPVLLKLAAEVRAKIVHM